MADKLGSEFALGSPKTQNDIKRGIDALESIAASLKMLASGPTQSGKPAGDGLLKILARIAAALEKK